MSRRDRTGSGAANPEVSAIIDALGMTPHPEGGWYAETWRAAQRVGFVQRDGRAVERAAGTSIAYLLEAGDQSSFHRIASDEVWYWQGGGAMLVHVLSDGYTLLRVGPVDASGARPQAVVPAGAWFAAEPAPGAAFSLAGCGVSPGFEFADLEMGIREALRALYPAHAQLIDRLTRHGSSVHATGDRVEHGGG